MRASGLNFKGCAPIFRDPKYTDQDLTPSHKKFMGIFVLFPIVMGLILYSLPVLAWESFIAETQAYYTVYYTSFYFQSGNNVFEEAGGKLHVAYVENYELYYLKSTDGGKNWTKEHLATVHDGDIRIATLTVDHNGNVFIAFTCNDHYNYSNPTGVVYGLEFYEDLYCIHNKSGSWSVETIYKPSRSGFSDNYGPRAMAMVVDGNNDVNYYYNNHDDCAYNNHDDYYNYVDNCAYNDYNCAYNYINYYNDNYNASSPPRAAACAAFRVIDANIGTLKRLRVQSWN